MGRGEVAVVGVGNTAQGELPGRTANDIAVEALRLALDDAGVRKRDIDGLITCRAAGGQGTDTQIGQLAGLEPRFSATLDYGTCNFSLHLAMMAIAAGMATTVALVYGTNQRTAGNRFAGVADSGEERYFEPYGYRNIAGPSALAFRRHQHLYGTTEEQLGAIAVTQRAYARMNPLAIFTEPLTMEGYLASRYIVRPLRRPDLCMISDGGVALIVTAADRAADGPHTPAYVLAAAQRAGLRHYQHPDALLRPWVRPMGEELFAAAGIGRSDVDALYVQDATSVTVLLALEDYGYCEPGAAGPFAAGGALALDGALPTNTNGGQLSESYMWGWLHLCEAVRQLRGTCGPRQVPAARIVHYASTMGYRKAASSILGSVIP